MLRKTRIIWRCIFLCLAAVCVVWWGWQKCFHLKTFVITDKLEYEPGFFYSTPTGTINGKTAFRQIQEGHLKKGKKKYIEGYSGAYPEDAENALKEQGYDEFYGQLMFYRHYQDKKIYVYDNWYEEKLFWQVFVLSGETVKEFQIAKEDNFDSVTNCTADDAYLYVHLYTNQTLDGEEGVIVIVQIEIETGEQKKYAIKEKDFGNTLSNEMIWFDPRAERLIALTYAGNQKEIRAYSFQTGEKKIIPLKRTAKWILASEDGFLLVNPSSGRIAFYAYDLDWNPMPERDIEVPILNKADITRLKPLAGYLGAEPVHLVDGIAYGCIEGEKVLWYYAVDLEAKELAALWEVRPPKGKLSFRQSYLFNKETGCEPYPTLF